MQISGNFSPGTPQSSKLVKGQKKLQLDDPEYLRDSFKDLYAKIESPLGVPPPDDGEVSFTSLNSSISVPETDMQDQISLIKNKNKELRKAATLTIQDFKNTSRNLLSHSQLNSGKSSMILHELENLKKNLEGAYEEAKGQNSVNKSINMNSIESDDNMSVVYQKIQDIQREINEAAQRLLESEKMIMTTEEKNQTLENRIRELEKSLNHLDITEGPEKSRNENCLCIVS